MAKYAEGTDVSIERSRAEIERTLKRFGATGFLYGWNEHGHVLGFRHNNREIKYILPMPPRSEFRLTPTGIRRSASSIESAYEQAYVSAGVRWRSWSRPSSPELRPASRPSSKSSYRTPSSLAVSPSVSGSFRSSRMPTRRTACHRCYRCTTNKERISMHPANARRHWTPGDLTTMRLLLDEGRSYADIARTLKRRKTAVFTMCMQQGISHRRHPELRSAAQIAPLFRVTTNMLCKWIERGWMPARNAASPTAHRPYWRIHDVDILAFLENDETWIAWAPGQMTDPDLRAYTYELRAGPPRWIAVKEIAQRFGVGIDAVQKWINLGLLPAVKYHAYYVRAEHVAAFVPPCRRKES